MEKSNIFTNKKNPSDSLYSQDHSNQPKKNHKKSYYTKNKIIKKKQKIQWDPIVLPHRHQNTHTKNQVGILVMQLLICVVLYVMI